MIQIKKKKQLLGERDGGDILLPLTYSSFLNCGESLLEGDIFLSVSISLLEDICLDGDTRRPVGETCRPDGSCRPGGDTYLPPDGTGIV